MALTHLTDYPALLGTSAAKTTGTAGVISVPAASLGVTDSTNLKVEGFILALLEHAYGVVSTAGTGGTGPDNRSVMAINKTDPFVSTRDNANVTTERFTVTFYTPITIGDINPTSI